MECDDNGWRKPRPDTISYQVYTLTCTGLSPRAIGKKLGKPTNTIRVMVHRFKHPGQHNKRSLDQYHRRKRKEKEAISIV